MPQDTIVIHVYTGLERPGLHIWRPGTAIGMNLLPTSETGNGWFRFDYCEVNPVLHESIRFKLFQHEGERGTPIGFGSQTRWEDEVHAKDLRPLPNGSLPPEIWCWQGCSRVAMEDRPGLGAAKRAG